MSIETFPAKPDAGVAGFKRRAPGEGAQNPMRHHRTRHCTPRRIAAATASAMQPASADRRKPDVDGDRGPFRRSLFDNRRVKGVRALGAAIRQGSPSISAPGWPEQGRRGSWAETVDQTAESPGRALMRGATSTGHPASWALPAGAQIAAASVCMQVRPMLVSWQQVKRYHAEYPADDRHPRHARRPADALEQVKARQRASPAGARQGSVATTQPARSWRWIEVAATLQPQRIRLVAGAMSIQPRGKRHRRRPISTMHRAVSRLSTASASQVVNHGIGLSSHQFDALFHQPGMESDGARAAPDLMRASDPPEAIAHRQYLSLPARSRLPFRQAGDDRRSQVKSWGRNFGSCRLEPMQSH